MKKQRIVKMTKHLPALEPVGLNQFNAKNYADWCEAESNRIGKDAYVMFETKKNGIEWCHIERTLSSSEGKNSK